MDEHGDWQGGNDIDRHVGEAWRSYQLNQCDDGRRLALAATTMDPYRGDAWYVLAVNLERLGRLAQADRAWQRAVFSPIHPQPAPYRVGWGRFQRAIERAADALPPPMRRALEEVELVLKNHPLPELVPDPDGDEPLVLQLGPTRAEAEGPDEDGEPPAAIHCYRRAHEHRVGRAREFDALVRASLIEGLGQFMGLNQEEIGRLIDQPD